MGKNATPEEQKQILRLTTPKLKNFWGPRSLGMTVFCYDLVLFGCFDVVAGFVADVEVLG